MSGTPPTSETMVRNDDDDDDTAAKKKETTSDGEMTIQIVPLAPEHFRAVHEIEVAFDTFNKGCCFGLLRYSWCPSEQYEFDNIYRNNESRRETYGVAVWGNKVVGFCKGRRYGQKMVWEERVLHNPKKGEFYIDTLAVQPETRGKGVGTKLLQWAEDKATEKGDTQLVLGVMEGNPAMRLYTRFGFEEQNRGCRAGCLIGRPHGSMMGIFMVKDLSSSSSVQVHDA